MTKTEYERLIAAKRARAERRVFRPEDAVRRSWHYNAYHRAAKRGLDCTLDFRSIDVPSHCPVLGIPLFRTPGQITDNSPSLDRIDSTKGYVEGNVVVVSQRANRLKSDATISELRRIADFYEVFYG